MFYSNFFIFAGIICLLKKEKYFSPDFHWTDDKLPSSQPKTFTNLLFYLRLRAHCTLYKHIFTDFSQSALSIELINSQSISIDSYTQGPASSCAYLLFYTKSPRPRSFRITALLHHNAAASLQHPQPNRIDKTARAARQNCQFA